MMARSPDIGFIPTPNDALDAMIDLAGLTACDRVYDLGCGDGRILIKAVQHAECRGVGIDIDPVRIAEAQQLAHRAGVGDRLRFRCQDLYQSEFQDATVVFLYLLPHLNLKLRPRLLAQLQSGARIVSHQFDMGDWICDRRLQLSASEEESTLFLWRTS